MHLAFKFGLVFHCPGTYRLNHIGLRKFGSQLIIFKGGYHNGSFFKHIVFFGLLGAGPMLSSGMCTEVFQFDVSPAPGAIVPASSMANISAEHQQNTTHLNKGRNRRILHGLPIPLAGSTHNITKEGMGRNSEKDNFQGSNKSVSSMVVSVLFDPREAGDSDGDSMMGPKSLSRIFVVVLLDSVKYVTYSCGLPLKGSAPHLVTT